MQDEMTPGGEAGAELQPHAPDPSRALPVPGAKVLPLRSEARPRSSELRQIRQLLEEAAGLTLDVLDLAGDMIAERLGLRRTEGNPRSDPG